MDKDVNRVLNYLTERLEIAINHSKDEEQRGYIRVKGMVKDARELGFKPDMREKIKEYTDELDIEVNRCNSEMEELSFNERFDGENSTKIDYCIIRAKTIMEIQNDLQSRLDELV